jgi:hypothetical protein
MVEDARNDVDLGFIDDEDGAFKQLDPKKGKFQGADLDLKEEDQAPMALPTCCSSSTPHEVAEVAADALGSATFPKVAHSKVRIEVSSFKSVEVAREEMHLGLGFATKAKEGIRDVLNLPESQVCIQGMRAITTTAEVIDVPSSNTLALAFLCVEHTFSNRCRRTRPIGQCLHVVAFSMHIACSTFCYTEIPSDEI